MVCKYHDLRGLTVCPPWCKEPQIARVEYRCLSCDHLTIGVDHRRYCAACVAAPKHQRACMCSECQANRRRIYGHDPLLRDLAAPAFQKQLDTVDVTHASTSGKLPVGIRWNAEEWRVPDDYKRRLRLVFAGYVRQATPLKLYPSLLGDGFTLRPGKADLDLQLWWNHFHVGDVIQNPNSAGFPHDGPGLPLPPEQRLLAAPASQKQPDPTPELPNFGWDPGDADD